MAEGANPNNVIGYEALPPHWLPRSVHVVAWVFIAIGIAAVIEMILAPFWGRFSIDAGVLGIFIGRGLLRRSRGWRIVALVVLWIQIAGCVAGVIFALLFLSQAQLHVGHRIISGVPPIALAAVFAGLLVAFGWMCLVLSRRSVAAWFNRREA